MAKAFVIGIERLEPLTHQNSPKGFQRALSLRILMNGIALVHQGPKYPRKGLRRCVRFGVRFDQDGLEQVYHPTVSGRPIVNVLGIVVLKELRHGACRFGNERTSYPCRRCRRSAVQVALATDV